MKKIISLLLVLALCLSLAACSGGGVDSAIEEADKLLANGDYAGALAVLDEADAYSQLAEKANSIRLSQIQKDSFSILGTWKDTDGYYTITFNDDFTGTWINGESQMSMDYEITADGKIYITYPSNMKLIPTQADGINQLVNESGGTVLVSEADYEQFVPDVIEITMDNYLEYFELRETIELYTNEFGEVENFYFGHGLFLKEEYIGRLASLQNVSFELEADQEFRTAELDEVTGAYTLGESYDGYNWDWNGGKHKAFSASVMDRRNWNDDPRCTSYQQICGIASQGMSTTDYNTGNRYYCVLENPVITRIQGTIELYK